VTELPIGLTGKWPQMWKMSKEPFKSSHSALAQGFAQVEISQEFV
jgi:hypothetical protein